MNRDVFSPHGGDFAVNAASMTKNSVISNLEHQALSSDADDKHGSDVFLYAAQNNVRFSEAPSAEKEGKAAAKPQERAGAADLEALNRFFKQSEEQSRAAGHEDPDARYLAQRQHYNEMKRLQTSQGPRPAKSKSGK